MEAVGSANSEGLLEFIVLFCTAGFQRGWSMCCPSQWAQAVTDSHTAPLPDYITLPALPLYLSFSPVFISPFPHCDSECGVWSSVSISWKQLRNAGLSFHPRPLESETLTTQQQSVLGHALQGLLMRAQLCQPWFSDTCSGSSSGSPSGIKAFQKHLTFYVVLFN